MKRCTYCGKEYPDEATACSLDQHPLACCAPGPEEAGQTEPDETWPVQIVVPVVLWLIVYSLLAVLCSLETGYVFSLACAFWAAKDCSKFGSRGSRVLGIAFKPVVVFAVCAFFLWGFGFIWYLILRHRIKSAPVDSFG